VSNVVAWVKVGGQVSNDFPFWLIFLMLTATIGMMVPELFEPGKSIMKVYVD